MSARKKINTKEKVWAVIIAAVLIFVSAGYVAAQSVSGFNDFYVKSNGTNIRSCKSTSCKIIGKLKRNAILTIRARSVRDLSSWIKISFRKGGKQYTGYISKTVLALVPHKPVVDQKTSPSSKPTLSGIFTEDFSGGFPGNKWVISSESSGSSQPSPQIDSIVGNPAPSLAVPFSSGGSNIILPGKKVTAEVNPFSSSNGFSVSVDVRQPDTSLETGELGTWIRNFKFTVKHLTNKDAYASVEIKPDAAQINYMISREYIGGGASYVTAPYMPDANFHTFKFTVDADGNAKWLRDGILKNSFDGFPTGDYLVSFSASGRNLPIYSTSTASYSHNVDNILVTVP